MSLSSEVGLPSATTHFLTLPFRRKKKQYTINPPDGTYQVIYLGNVLTVMAKGEECVEKPLGLVWKTYCSKHGSNLSMKLTVTRSGLKAETRQQGITEYWAHRITYCLAPKHLPNVFCWVYKHEGKRMKPELRCHAVLCKKGSEPNTITQSLKQYLQAALQEYRREKLSKQKARLNAQIVGQISAGPKRKLLLQTGSLNFRPPMSRSKSAPRLFAIDEEDEILEEEHQDDLSDLESLYYRHMQLCDEEWNSVPSTPSDSPSLSGQNSSRRCHSIDERNEATSKPLMLTQTVSAPGSSSINSDEIEASDDGVKSLGSNAESENKSWKVKRLHEMSSSTKQEVDAVSEESGYQDYCNSDDDIFYNDDSDLDESQYEEQVTAL